MAKKPDLSIISCVGEPEPNNHRVFECRQCSAREGTESGPSAAFEVKTQFEVTGQLKVKGGHKRLICAYCFMHGEMNFITR